MSKLVVVCLFLVLVVISKISSTEDFFAEPKYDAVKYETVTDYVNSLNEDPFEVTDIEDYFEEDYPREEPPESRLFKLDYEFAPNHQVLQRRDGRRMRQDMPCPMCDHHQPTTEYPPRVGSLRGIPGVDYPNYTDIPLTSFSCAGRHTPGFYADLETRCQVFHVCYPHRRESFLCPVGTTFNQPILACDYWYNGNCTASAVHFEHEEDHHLPEDIEDLVSEIVDEIVETSVTEAPRPRPVSEHSTTHAPTPEIPVGHEQPPPPSDQLVSLIAKFLPIKAKVVTRVNIPAHPLAETQAKVSFSLTKQAASRPQPFVKPLQRPVPVAIPVQLKTKPVPVAALIQSIVPAGKTAVVGKKLAVGKAKLAAPLVKPLVVKAALKAKVAKVAAVPVISVMTKKQIAAAVLKKLSGYHNVNVGANHYY